MFGIAQRALRPDDFDPPLRAQLLVLQPTPFCNIDCAYCYLPQRDDRRRMSVATVRLAVRRLVEDRLIGPNLTIAWHAGEPLVLPPTYYEEAFGIVAEEIGSRVAVSHSFQTNATLITDRWCEFFTAHAVKVGVSVDGPAFLHDKNRRTRNGKGTHALVLRGLAALKRHGIEHHAIAVVTDEALKNADAIYDFFREQAIHDVGFNFDEIEGENRSSSLSGLEELHGEFLDRMLAHMTASKGQWQVRELARALHVIADGVPVCRARGEVVPENGQTRPFAIISVAASGEFSTFSPELLGQTDRRFGDFVLGNVTTSGYLAASRTAKFRSIWKEVRRGVRTCQRTCAHFEYCGGGAPVNKLYENGDMSTGETLFCRLMIKHPFDAVLRLLESEVERV